MRDLNADSKRWSRLRTDLKLLRGNVIGGYSRASFTGTRIKMRRFYHVDWNRYAPSRCVGFIEMQCQIERYFAHTLFEAAFVPVSA
jgi:hypothetical protein